MPSKYKINDYGLPNAIKKRIHTLALLQVSPDTINLLITELMEESEEIREKIGKYLEELLLVENYKLEESYIVNKEITGMKNTQMELIIRTRKENLEKLKKLFEVKKIQFNEFPDLKSNILEGVDELSIFKDVKSAMTTNNSKMTLVEIEREHLRQRANLKRKIELEEIELNETRKLELKKLGKI